MNTRTSQHTSRYDGFASFTIFSAALLVAGCNPGPTDADFQTTEVNLPVERVASPVVRVEEADSLAQGTKGQPTESQIVESTTSAAPQPKQEASSPATQPSSDATAPQTLDGLVRDARRLMDAGDFPQALSLSEQALALDVGSAKALHVNGRALLALGRADQAIESLALAHEAAPQNGYIANTLGYALIQSGKASEAIVYLEVAKNLIPHIGYVHNNLAVAYERTGRIDEAIEQYRQAVEAGDPEGKAAASLERLQSAR